jgi:flagellar motor switch protein FliN
MVSDADEVSPPPAAEPGEGALSHEIDLPPLTPPEAGEGLPAAGGLERLTEVSVELAVELGRTMMTLGQALALGPGSVVTLDRQADKPVDLLVNGRTIARGEVVVADEKFGLRITEVPDAAGSNGAPAG